MIETINIEWTQPKKISNGGFVRNAIAPTNAFWSVWKANKEALKSDGVRVKPGRNGGWDVALFTDTDAPINFQGEPTGVGSGEGAVNAGSSPVSSIKFEIPTDVNWSAEQLAIFSYFQTGSGHLVVQARAGTGKTTTIKVALGVAPERRKLYAVFNKKNQREAIDKIGNRPDLDILTLHALGFKFIQNFWRGSKPDDIVEQDRIVAVCAGIPEDPGSAVERLVGFAKNTFVRLPSIDELAQLADDKGIFSGLEKPEDGGWVVSKLAMVAFDAMKAALVRDEFSRISFNDMVWLPVAQNWVKPIYDLVCIDEAQDMNAPQLEIATRACTPTGRIIIVGDNRQAIYGFRGAAEDGMGTMQSKLNAAVLGLTITYRCPKAVVAIANEIVSDYHAAESAPEGIVDEIGLAEVCKQAVIGNAILSRLNAPLMSICLQLLRNNVSARIEGRDVGRQLVGMVRKLKARSVPDFYRKLEVWGEKQKARVHGAKADAKVALIDDQVATLSAVGEGCENVKAIEARITGLFEDSDSSTAKPAVVLSSVHKAKGLEWDRVFIIESTFRKGKSVEEDNIFYVAVTRAKNTLTFAV